MSVNENEVRWGERMIYKGVVTKFQVNEVCDNGG